ncbi:putative nuclease [Oscillibacter valericigenes Sjm18-20]|nr:putative nuclease [Oscillibacter valericigenes Sjm18-20]
MYYVYLLRCGDGSLYTGITTDPARRLAEHQGQGGRGAKYTAARRAVRMEAVWTAADRSSASRLERHIKQLAKREKEALIKGQLPESPEFEAYQKEPISPDGSVRPMSHIGCSNPKAAGAK